MNLNKDLEAIISALKSANREKDALINSLINDVAELERKYNKLLKIAKRIEVIKCLQM